MAYRGAALEKAVEKPYDIYRRPDLGEGGYARAPASETKQSIAPLVQKKHNR